MFAAAIRDILAQAKSPVPFNALAKQSKLSTEAFEAALAAEEGREGIYRWPEAGRQQRFWSIAPAEFARRQILDAASVCALPAGELAKQAHQKAHGYPEKLVRSLVQQLIEDKELRKYPVFGREPSLIGRTGHPAAYAEAARRFIAKIEAKVRAEGGSLETVPKEPSAAEAILDAMQRLEPAGSAPVSVHKLRASLPGIGKPAFDAAALALWSGQRVFLSRHDYSQSLSPEERNLLIDSLDGNYYVAIRLRTH
jgi:hypothetical protein